MKPEITERLATGQYARLIPTVADSKKEERATSALLASFMVVPSFAKKVLSNVRAPVGKRIKIVCYTEVTFKNNEKNKKSRPDGLIIITNGTKQWTALVESKIGNTDLAQEQIEDYLDLAKAHGINALITISNQFATTPTHHPVKVTKNKLRSVELFHFSWLSLKSEAVLLTANKNIEDPEQSYILSELVRYLDHDSSGVTSLTRMPSEWKELSSSVQRGASLAKTSEMVKSSIAGWHQLLKHLSLNLSMSIGQPVSIALSRSKAKNAELNFTDDCAYLAQNNSLSTEFEIPNAASKITFSADCSRRTLNISMKLDAPKGKTRATASINWITRQLKGKDVKSIGIRAYWPRRTPMTSVSLTEATANPSALIPEGVSDLPTHLEIIRIIDLAARFKGPKTFAEDSTKEFPLFYQDVGQHLSKWRAKAPQVKEAKSASSDIPNILDKPIIIPSKSEHFSQTTEKAELYHTNEH
ncbi:MAG: hypothetical protein COB22_00825 [Cycloclasticus sp.]|nr:MAG: hypothetical protein COB22_00825 [Cycloclasticus sp.]